MSENRYPQKEAAYIEKAKIFGQNLRTARKEMGHTMEAFAKGIGVTTAYIGLIERGERTPSFQTLIKICEFVGQDIGLMLVAKEGADAPAPKKGKK
ncbi:MAG: helix-turn-helix domain-containing protein [Defluviitaleaceae bacterium]|nr:helix-turn-helix domain-containing protein [Defluviitaleaceae bacterium]